VQRMVVELKARKSKEKPSLNKLIDNWDAGIKKLEEWLNFYLQKGYTEVNRSKKDNKVVITLRNKRGNILYLGVKSTLTEDALLDG
jgi:hypothetical protein